MKRRARGAKQLVVLAGLFLASVAAAQEPPPLVCPEGRQSDPTGHCCWPGQVWGEQSGQCRGQPTCPAGLMAQGESCVAAACPLGQQLTPDALHCCWPNQEWSSATQACIGIPACPQGLQPDATGRTCVSAAPQVAPPLPASSAPPSAPPAPLRCEPPNVQGASGCVSAEQAAHEASEARWGPLSWTFGIGYSFVGVPINKVTGHSAEATLGMHIPGVPLLLHIGGSLGGYHTNCGFDSACGANGLFLTWRVGAAFAPFSGPDREGGFSPFNPFIGGDALAISFRSASCSGSSCGSSRVRPDDTIVPALSIGDVIFIDDQSFIFRASISANSQGPIFTGTVEIPGLVALLIGAYAL